MNTLHLHEPGQPAGEHAREAFRHDLRSGLRRVPRSVPGKYLHDTRGSELFDALRTQPEYYLSRTERHILAERAQAIAIMAGPGAALVELGAGPSHNARVLLDRMTRPAAYVPIDISARALERTIRTFTRRYRALPVIPVCTDYTRFSWQLPVRATVASRRVFHFPASTFGNFEPAEAVRFLSHLRHMGTPDDVLVIGVDLVKDARIIEAACNDRAGLAAAFNLNLLERANRELWCDFSLRHFSHRAVYDRDRSRVEMGLLSKAGQTVHLDGEAFAFTAGELMITGYSYKYHTGDLADVVRGSGWSLAATWCDPENLSAVACFHHPEA